MISLFSSLSLSHPLSLKVYLISWIWVFCQHVCLCDVCVLLVEKKALAPWDWSVDSFTWGGGGPGNRTQVL